LQVALVSRALLAAHPTLEVECLTRASAGDRDQTSPLWQMGDRGAFTADLSDALRQHQADLVVHSFKDLPVALPDGTELAGALPRADPRDVLLMRRAVVADKPAALTILSSSPRRAWLLQETLRTLLPWTVGSVDTQPVRGNIETRLRKLVEGQGHGLVMAKAALDRLLTFGAPFEAEAATVRGYLDQCEWMVMPMREFPWAPAQGAIALEVASGRSDVASLVAPIICATTTAAVHAEREVLAASGGGCHQALGAAIVEKPYGRVISVRSKGNDGSAVQRWELANAQPAFPRTTPDRMWPRPGEEVRTTRHALPASRPAPEVGLWIARADALPAGWAPTPATIVWASGSQTWKRLAAAGVWVHGSADGLGDADPPAVNALAGRAVNWVRLTHLRQGLGGQAADGASGDALATYATETKLPDDLPERSHFFWMSGSLFTQALERWPVLRDGWHASGPGRTHQVIAAALGSGGRTGVWLDRESWEKETCL
jgi:hydroxymethylbilane synthase